MITITIRDADDIEELFLMYERMQQILECWSGECDHERGDRDDENLC